MLNVGTFTNIWITCYAFVLFRHTARSDPAAMVHPQKCKRRRALHRQTANNICDLNKTFVVLWIVEWCIWKICPAKSSGHCNAITSITQRGKNLAINACSRWNDGSVLLPDCEPLVSAAFSATSHPTPVRARTRFACIVRFPQTAPASAASDSPSALGIVSWLHLAQPTDSASHAIVQAANQVLRRLWLTPITSNSVDTATSGGNSPGLLPHPIACQADEC